LAEFKELKLALEASYDHPDARLHQNADQFERFFGDPAQ
jgi:hypothetical protein